MESHLPRSGDDSTSSQVMAWFVSDVHLIEESDPRGCAFLQFLRSLNASNCSHLFLVGDIFDLWISNHQYFVKKFPGTLAELQRLKALKIEIHYFEGNHDLYLQDYFYERLGVHVHSGPEHFQLGRWQVRVEHGDQIDQQDYGYRFLRWFLRTPVLAVLARSLPGQLVAALGEFLSRRSRTYTSTVKTITATRTIEKLRAHARTQRALKPFDVLISGHVHEQDDYRFVFEQHDVRALNLGTWLKSFVAFRLGPESHEFMELNGIVK